MEFNVDGEIRSITIKAWDGEQLGCDMMCDLEIGYVFGQSITEQEYKDLVDFWQDEINRYNSGKASEQFGNKVDNTVVEYIIEYT